MEGRMPLGSGGEWEELLEFLSALSSCDKNKYGKYAGYCALVRDFLKIKEVEFLEFCGWTRENAALGVPEEKAAPDVVVEGGVVGSGSGAEAEARDGHSLEEDSASAAVVESREGGEMGAGAGEKGAEGPPALLSFDPAVGDGSATPTGGEDATLKKEKRKRQKKKKKSKALEPACVSSSSLKLKPGHVMELKVEDIRNSFISHDCCLPIDVLKWEEIIKRCNSKTVILLPEGAFSFPPMYALKSNTPGLTISGKGPDSTTLCIQHGLQYYTACPHILPVPNALHVCSSLTLENLTVKGFETAKYGWPGLTFFEKKTNCVVRNVKFFNCSLIFSSELTVVEDCEFSSNLVDVSVMPPPADKRDLTGSGMEFFGGDGGCGGSIIENVTFRNLFCGIRKLCLSLDSSKPDLIKNVKCWNVNTGVHLVYSKGDTVKDLTYELWNDDDDPSSFLKNRAAAVVITGGDENTVDGILCKGNRTDFTGFVIMSGSSSHGKRKTIPRRNKIRNVKGAGGRYLDEGKDTEISNVGD